MRLVLATRLVALVAAPVTLYLVATRLAPAEQGVYFVFVNAQAVAQLFEVGVATIVVQYASHEASALRWTAAGSVEGQEAALDRLSGALRRLARWYLGAAVLFAGLALPLGLALFAARPEAGVPPFAAPWAVTVVATAAYLLIVPVLATLEGCGRLVNVQRMRLVQAVVLALCAWALVPTAGGLVAVAAMAVAQLVIASVWLWRRHPALLADAARAPRPAANRATPALLGTQTRTAVNWLGSHVALQALTPIVLYYRGPAAAGQVGMTLAVAVVPYTLGMAWLQGRFPEYGAFVSRSERGALDRVALRASVHAATVCAVGIAAALAVLVVLGHVAPHLRERLLPTPAFLALGGATLTALAIQAMAGYLRADRREPLLPALLAGYAVMLAAAWVGAARWGATTAVVAYAAAAGLVALPITAAMFARHRRAGAPV